MQTSLLSTPHEKIRPRHLERLALVYVRQSTAQQVLNNQESTRLQYALTEHATALGWPEQRVEVIDDDLGKSGASAEGRLGFQRLVSEVSLDHVGIILGVEISRLARSCKDWHQLLELCALFGTLIADTDGIYDSTQYNDRLLLGLKGTMSEAELHVIRQRMDQGRLSKARRGELRFRLPAGYVQDPCGEILIDPDEQVQSVIRLVFRKFKELGTVNAVLQYLVRHDIRIGGRSYVGTTKNQVTWRRPIRTTLTKMLKSPLYAGAYAYGMRQMDPRRKQASKPCSGLIMKPRDEWIALIRDRLPAYITWEEHEWNLARIEANRSHFEAIGTPRRGLGLLSGVLRCGRCGRRMTVAYNQRRSEPHRYYCCGSLSHYGGEACFSIAGPYLDEAIAELLLRAIQPASLELSLRMADDLEQEREQLRGLWVQRLERASYEVNHARRQYEAVDPENRLVARELERNWEEKLREHRGLEEDFRRFESTQTPESSTVQREEIEGLAEDLPALWNDAQTANSDRKAILRAVVDSIVVAPRGQSERVELEVRWVGDAVTRFEIVRSVSRYERLSYFPQLCQRIRALVAMGVGAKGIAENLNREGMRPPSHAKVFDAQKVSKLLRRLGLVSERGAAQKARADRQLGENEWTVSSLARRLEMPEVTVHGWVDRGWIRARREGSGPKPRWIPWADEQEIRKLRERRRRGTAYESHRRWIQAVEARQKASPKP